MQHFTKLLVWQRSHKLVLAIYSASVGFPRSEQFGLTSQLRRAALLFLPTLLRDQNGKANPTLLVS